MGVTTNFSDSLDQITRADVGDMADFVGLLQARLDEKLENGNPPDTNTIEVDF